ncbi:MAG: phenylalanine--tRNA ligase subunit alpha [Candidatus Omnitrophota bacterium]|jgi:phenylalanyl-tRNA synthetase alpha chain|nr:MAG: phenylalanine--tRNA ligase subunit alpha [Candidatus Omnitrophota bacterium]
MDIEAIKNQITSDLKDLGSLQGLEEVRVKYLGRKGLIAQLTSSIPSLPDEERASFGRKVNEFKSSLLALLDEKQKAFLAGQEGVNANTIDIGMPGIAPELGHLHPITKIIHEVCAIFRQMGFSIVEGPEIETEFNNFTGLNIPLEHPSRDVFDTFYLATKDTLLLRSHTSPVQIRAMKSHKPPLAIVVPGRVYRPDAVDASHSFMFHQIEGFVVDTDITFADLKGTLEFFAKAVFGKDISMRFRPHFFPFTEPSAEVDISCILCKGKGCSLCGRKGWLEILGSGMIHPNVFKHVGYDPKEYTGFAFGMGVERIALLKYGIDDIRLFFENDLRFLKQF